MITLNFDIYQTVAVAVLVLFIGKIIKNRVNILDRFLIPDPVIGGILVSLIALLGYATTSFGFVFDTTMQDVFMTAFFTSVGYSCDLKGFVKSGKKGLQLCLIIVLIIFMQSGIGIALANLFGFHSLLGLSSSTVGLIGGHGTAAAFGPILEDLTGIDTLTTVALATATFGLIAGGLIGGPIAKRLIKKHDILPANEGSVKDSNKASNNPTTEDNSKKDSRVLTDKNLMTAALQIMLAMGLGTIISSFLERIGLTFPAYMGAMIMGLIIRNITEYSGRYRIPMPEIDSIGKISLSIFVAMALMTLELWQLADLAIPLIVILLTEVMLMGIFLFYVAFRILGKDYDAVVMISGIAGFGLGAMPNAMANMQEFTSKFPLSPTAFFVIPAIGSLAIDFGNSLLITFFMNLFS